MSGQLHLAMVIARLNVGGPALQVLLTTGALLRRGHRTLLLAGHVPPGETSMEYLADTHGVPVTRVPGLSRGLSWLRDSKALLGLMRVFRAHRPMVVHTHTAKAGTLGRLAAIACGVPVRVHTFHGHVFKGYFSPRRVGFFLAIERLLARRTDCIIALSASQKRELVDEYRVTSDDKVAVVPLGLDLDPLLRATRDFSAFRASIGCPPDALLVGWIGRLTAVKEPHRFLDAAARLGHDRTDLRFVMVGDGELQPELAARVLAGRPGRCALPGVIRDMPAAYVALDLIVLTSRSEGTPVVLLEGMAAGRPFVATRVGGICDLMVGRARPMAGGFEVYDNGVLADENAEALAAAVSFLLDRPDERRRMGEAGRAFVTSHFSASRLADDLEALYRRLLTEKATR